MAQVTYSFRIDEELKKQAEDFCNDVGMNLSTMLMLYIKRVTKDLRLPFEISANDSFSLEQAVSDSLKRENLHGPYDTAQSAVDAMLED